MGGRRPKPARGSLPSHFASAMGALVWRCPTAVELCNSHRDQRQHWEHRSRETLARESAAATTRSAASRAAEHASLGSPPHWCAANLAEAVEALPRQSPGRAPVDAARGRRPGRRPCLVSYPRATSPQNERTPKVDPPSHGDGGEPRAVAPRGGCCINPLPPGPVGGRRANAANTGPLSHFVRQLRAFVWRGPTAFELCNSHRDLRHH